MAITGPNTAYLKAQPGIAPYPPMTIAAWFLLPATAGSNSNTFWYVQGPNSSWAFDLHFAGNPTPNRFGSSAQSDTGKTINCTMTGPEVNPAQGWHHMLSTFDDSGGIAGQVKTVCIYRNGLLDNCLQTGGPVDDLINNDGTSLCYAMPGSTSGGGTVAYGAIWKRVLSQAEITALAANGDPRTVAPAALVSFVDFNSATGPIADLVSPTITWNLAGTGSLSVAANPFALLQVTPVPGTVIAPNTTIDALMSSYFQTRDSGRSSAPSYKWADYGRVAGVWSDGSHVTLWLEARPLYPAVVKL